MKLKLLFALRLCSVQALIVIMLAGSACTSYDRCMRKFGQTSVDTVEVYIEHIIPKDSVITRVHIDSIQYLIHGQIYEAESGRATIQYWKDQYSNLLHMKAECDSVVIRDTLYLEVIKHEFKPEPVKKEKGYFFSPGGQIATALFSATLLILSLVIYKRIKK